MLKDRDQKEDVLRYVVSKHWFPQLELDVNVQLQTEANLRALTDIDVHATVPDPFKGVATVVFDCKTKMRESPINRAVWVKGLLGHLGATHGFCILKRDIPPDHRISAARMGVTLLTESDFGNYAKAFSPSLCSCDAACSVLANWEHYYASAKRFPKIEDAWTFTRRGYWNSENPSQAVRKTLALIKSIRNELDPRHSAHIALCADLCALMVRALAIIANEFYHIFALPKTSVELGDFIKLILYGGKEAYEHRNQLWQMVAAREGKPLPDLALPEWESFLKLFRQILDSPEEILFGALLLKEIALGCSSGHQSAFARDVAANYKQGSRFAILAMTYFQKAGGFPAEIGEDIVNRLASLSLPTRPDSKTPGPNYA